MDRNNIKHILNRIENHEITVDQALHQLAHLPFEDLGFATVDHHRALRRGYPEVVFCQSKTPEQVVGIIKSMAPNNDVLGTRVGPQVFAAIREHFPAAEYNEIARTVTLKHPQSKPSVKTDKSILICSAGTSDMQVAEETAVTAEAMGNPVERLYDVGVAGIHRLFHNKDKIDRANVLVVVAGMDGVLPTIVSGIVAKPVIAVPTSVGYGANFQGVAPLLTMLNACSPGIAVVNIDNGFGAGYFASLINK